MTSAKITNAFINLVLFLLSRYKSLKDLLIQDLCFSVVIKDPIIVCQVCNSFILPITTEVATCFLASIDTSSILQNFFVKFNQVSGPRYLSHLLYGFRLKIFIHKFLEDVVEFGNAIILRDENAFI